MALKRYISVFLNNGCNMTITSCVDANYYDKCGKCLLYPEDKCYYAYICTKYITCNKLDFNIILNKSVILILTQP